ncbi:hypothetical protein AAVH_29110 [Aphelenchoides avenae]|nr:hypothetical protein AAVH_29110 [Aphelenchus avenae]
MPPLNANGGSPRVPGPGPGPGPWDPDPDPPLLLKSGPGPGPGPAGPGPDPRVWTRKRRIKANERCTASVVVTGSQTYYGNQGASSKTVSTKKGDVVFSFMQSGSSANTNVIQGQIPQILFRI